MGLLRWFKNAFLAVLTVAAFGAFGAGGWFAAFGKALWSGKSLFIFASSVLLSAFSSRKPNIELPELQSSVYGTNERAKTVYGETVVGGLIADISLVDDDYYAVRYALCDLKTGFDYTIVDVEIGGVWLRCSVDTLKQYNATSAGPNPFFPPPPKHTCLLYTSPSPRD